MLFTLISLGACERRGGDSLIDEVLSELSDRQRIEQLLLLEVSPRADNLEEIVLRPHSAGGIAGYWIETGEAEAVARFIRRLRGEGGGMTPLFAADLDEGVGGGIAGGSSFPSLSRVLLVSNGEEVRSLAQLIAEEARWIGLDLGIVRGPPLAGGVEFRGAEVAGLGDRWRALLTRSREEGVALAMELFWTPPGAERPAEWDRARLAAIELALLEQTREGAAGLVPGSHAHPALTGDTLPLGLSPAFAAIMRQEAGWEAPLILDLRPFGPAERPAIALRALRAGADLFLTDGDPLPIVDELQRARREGALTGGRLADATRRVIALKLSRRAAELPAPDSILDRLNPPAALVLAEKLADRVTFRSAAASTLPEEGDSTLLLVPAGRGNAFISAVRHLRHLQVLPLNLTADSLALVELLRATIPGNRTVLYLDFPRTGGPSIGSLLSALGDSLEDRVPIQRIEFRGGGERGRLDHSPPAAVTTWGLGAPSQRAAARSLLEMAPAAWFVGPGLQERTPGAAGMDSAKLTRVDEAIGQALERGTISAAALAIGRHGQLVRLRGYGTLDGKAVNARTTLFDLASLTKVVATTTAAALLVQDGTLRLDQPARSYLPALEGAEKNGITVAHLLTHTSGLPSGLPLYHSASSPEEALEQVMRAPMRAPPGERVEYSDLGMILLAELLEERSGQPLDEFLAERLFVPLGMASTFFLPPLTFYGRTVPSALESERPFPLRGVVHDGNAFRLGGVAGHAGLFSTASDMAIFAQMMLDGGSYAGLRILGDSIISAFIQRQPGAEERALGWDTPAPRSSAGRFLSARSFGHTGFTGTSLWIDPELDLFIVLLTNRTYENASAREILDLRIAVHEAVAQAITDVTVTPRPGAR